MDGLLSTGNVSFILVFIEGILSFFSPCVIPLIPVYMGYLAGSGKKQNEDGTIQYDRRKVFLHTVFFTIGISFTFFILGMSFTALGSFFHQNKMLFTKIGGILIVVLGLFQLGILEVSFLQRERKLQLSLGDKKMNPILALIMGFTFSFAWTPCIGPALSSVLIMASGASTAFKGNMLVFVYALGFLIPFLILGLFTSQALNFLKSKQKLLKYTIKLGGVILILMGVMTFTGWMNSVSGYLNSFTLQQQENTKNTEDKGTTVNNSNLPDTGNDALQGKDDIEKEADSDKEASTSDEKDTNSESSNSNNETEKENKIEAFDFTLTDQYGNEHTLSDYKGKVVFLNFWATWCPPCRKELPDIEALYKEYDLNEGDVIFLGITNPSSSEYPKNSDVSIDEIKDFLDENEYTFPVLFDKTGELLKSYSISAFPTTFMIDKEGNIFGYVPAMMTMDQMKGVINETLGEK
jgi:cytochrome c-type biogenesis protein